MANLENSTVGLLFVLDTRSQEVTGREYNLTLQKKHDLFPLIIIFQIISKEMHI